MTNSISPISQPPLPADALANASVTPPRPPAPATPEANAAPQSDSVTLSAAAQTTTQLLSAAREAAGVNPAAVAQIREALQGGSYNVSPDDLAQAIATVLKETN